MFGALDYLLCRGIVPFQSFWLLIRKIASHWVKHVLVIVFLAVFFTPVTAYPDNPYLAPAFFVSLYEGVMLGGKEAGFQRGLAPILAFSFYFGCFLQFDLSFMEASKRMRSS